MKLLVTGGAGFIGSNFIRYWLSRHPHDHLVNLDKLTYAGNLENLKDIEKNPNYEFVKGDITDPDDVRIAITNTDTIIHFAAESHVDRSILNPTKFISTNVVGTQVLLDAALEHKIHRFHHISTDEVFGELPLNSKNKFTNRTPYQPHSPYSASKAGSDHLVRAYYHTYHLPITISNCGNNFGPFQFPEKFIPLAITNILENKKVPIYGSGENIRDWLYVDDHCRALDMILNHGRIGKTYLIGGMTNNIDNNQVIKQICQIMKKDFNDYVEYIKNRPGHDLRYAVDWSETEKELNWRPEHNFHDWLQKTIEWYTNNSSWWQRVKTGQYLEYYRKQYG